MRSRAALVALACALLAAGGCGSEDESSAPAGAALETVTVSETEFALKPSKITLEEAGTYTLKAVNDGSVDHALEIEGEGGEGATDTIAPGASAELTVELKAGTYELYCPIDGHADQGMKGSVSVAGGGDGMNSDEDEDDEGGGGYGY
jgi:plastocyanin